MDDQDLRQDRTGETRSRILSPQTRRRQPRRRRLIDAGATPLTRFRLFQMKISSKKRKKKKGKEKGKKKGQARKRDTHFTHLGKKKGHPLHPLYFTIKVGIRFFPRFELQQVFGSLQRAAGAEQKQLGGMAIHLPWLCSSTARSGAAAGRRILLPSGRTGTFRPKLRHKLPGKAGR